MEKDGGATGCRRLQSGLSRVDLLLGFAESLPTHEDLADLMEKDVMFRDEETEAAGVYGVMGLTRNINTFQRRESKKRERSKWQCCKSAPVSVPEWPKHKVSEGFDDEDDEIVVRPPHELLAHYNTSFSVLEGIGRTLKGRDLCRVRNAVLKMTGFLD
ncbi:hypothetical protein SUGI_0321220 [Cryptomeria japonica]|uniref:protein S40-3 n=1 Tax=Cryptomeria japonica TaxID=3369 RepID=UPI002408B0DA|nr:protein S40-3 [Cryptomeria japonica]GLJ18177.1 hypothetical protein SUGI_0321220 [Cryptomeria japonica]